MEKSEIGECAICGEPIPKFQYKNSSKSIKFRCMRVCSRECRKKLYYSQKSVNIMPEPYKILDDYCKKNRLSKRFVLGKLIRENLNDV